VKEEEVVLERDAVETCRYALETLRHLRDHKPSEWDALVTPGLCSVWEELKRVVKRSDARDTRGGE
jgi:enhancing lycopene biosynthesis protein 2